MCVAKNVAVSDLTSEVKGFIKDERSSEAASTYIYERVCACVSVRVCLCVCVCARVRPRVRFMDSETAAAITMKIASRG